MWFNTYETNLETNQFAKADTTPYNMDPVKSKEVFIYRTILISLWLTGVLSGVVSSFLFGNVYQIFIAVCVVLFLLLLSGIFVHEDSFLQKYITRAWFLFVGTLAGITIASLALSTGPTISGLVWVTLISTPLLFGMKWQK